MKLRALLMAAAGLVAGACGDGSSAATQDAAADDAAVDSAPDAPGEIPTPEDAGADATPADAMPDIVPANFVAIAPCPNPSDYAAATQVIATADNRYSPACVRIAAGGTVTIDASTAHPLEPRPGGSPGNPIPTQGAPATVSFPAPGFYPFLCPEHVDQGMIGVVWVE
jgi:plastocyanin